MKKFIILSLLLLLGASILSFAQQADTKTTFTTPTPVSFSNQVEAPAQGISTYQVYELRSSLDLENLLLDRRKTALWLTVGGFIGTEVGTLIRDENGYITEGGAIIALTGGLTMLTGAVWLVANEFKLIRVQKKINENMLLSISPHGLKLNF